MNRKPRSWTVRSELARLERPGIADGLLAPPARLRDCRGLAARRRSTACPAGSRRTSASRVRRSASSGPRRCTSDRNRDGARSGRAVGAAAKRKAASNSSGEASLASWITISHYIWLNLFSNGSGVRYNLRNMAAHAFIAEPRIDPRFACFRLKAGPLRHTWLGSLCGAADSGAPQSDRIHRRADQPPRDRKRGLGPRTYLFTLDNYWTLDGAVGGSGAELINHSCTPNLYSLDLQGPHPLHEQTGHPAWRRANRGLSLFRQDRRRSVPLRFRTVPRDHQY